VDGLASTGLKYLSSGHLYSLEYTLDADRDVKDEKGVTRGFKQYLDSFQLTTFHLVQIARSFENLELINA
jgi:hypothetical protein